MKNVLSIVQIPKRSALLLLLLVSFAISAQEKGVQLEHNFTHKKVFYPENIRVKIKTKEGEKFVGNYSIIDDRTISINGTSISLDDIIKFKKRSKVGSIMRPVLATFSGICLIGAVAGAAAGGYGYLITVLLLPPGVATLVPVLLPNDHKPDKWQYSIITRTDNSQK